MDIKRKFGIEVRKRRKALGLSQEELAENAGLHRTYISSVERGLRNPTLTVISTIATGLSTSISELVEKLE